MLEYFFGLLFLFALYIYSILLFKKFYGITNDKYTKKNPRPLSPYRYFDELDIYAY